MSSNPAFSLLGPEGLHHLGICLVDDLGKTPEQLDCGPSNVIGFLRDIIFHVQILVIGIHSELDKTILVVELIRFLRRY